MLADLSGGLSAPALKGTTKSQRRETRCTNSPFCSANHLLNTFGSHRSHSLMSPRLYCLGEDSTVEWGREMDGRLKTRSVHAVRASLSSLKNSSLSAAQIVTERLTVDVVSAVKGFLLTGHKSFSCPHHDITAAATFLRMLMLHRCMTSPKGIYYFRDNRRMYEL